MMKLFEKSEQKGTLLVEAIAMLGLIAMVTPTLYKKSHERMTEIQDINAASQARIMNDVIETFIKANFREIVEKLEEEGDNVLKLCEEDSSGVDDCLEKGYSSVMPFGYKPGSIKGYGDPRVYVHKDGSSLVSYIIYPHISDPGKKRAARLASLVGANGGFVNVDNDSQKVFQGTGGAWYLDDKMIETITNNDSDLNLTENSLVVTANEPIENSTEDNDNYLYRGKDDDPYHNTMVTDLFMGGHSEETQWQGDAGGFYGIFNTKKLLMNTRCDQNDLDTGTWGEGCDPNVADLYIGKPHSQGVDKNEYTTNGAAWIYGNLSAVRDGFKVFRETDEAAPKFVFGDASSMAGPDFNVIEADSIAGSSSVGLLNKFIIARENSGAHEFLVGGDDGEDIENAMFYGSSRIDGRAEIRIARAGSSVVYINEKGGAVHINGGNSSDAATYINETGGIIQIGADDGEWFNARGESQSSRIDMLKRGGTFVVGTSSDAMIYADSSRIGFRKNRLEVFDQNDGMAPEADAPYKASSIVEGITNIATEYTDLLGSVFIGREMESSQAGDDGAEYNRAWRLGVAGSAWVDGMIWARQAWLKNAGMMNLHAGFSSFSDYNNNKQGGWLNVYGGDDGGIYVRNAGTITNAGNRGDIADTMVEINSSRVALRMYGASSGVDASALMLLDSDGAWIGKGENFFATSTGVTSGRGSSFVVAEEGINIYTTADSSYVDMQNGALYLGGRPGESGVLYNNIKARAGEFSLSTGSSGVPSQIDDVEFYANSDVVRTRYVDFEVQRDGSSNVFGVYPEVDSSSRTGSANVMIDGSINISGNDVFYVSHKEDSTRTIDERALFEVDPRYIRIGARGGVGDQFMGGSSATGGYYAMVEVDTLDISGGSSDVINDNRASIYIRKGAMEFEKSIGDSSWVADQGFGYIKANRFVSNAGKGVPNINASSDVTPEDFGGTQIQYDQYMVNPAYTSVMHDIKLTTRGNARLSDILPDYVLKGVYNVSNDRKETNKEDEVKGTGSWAHPYLGKIPYPMCPPGYRRLATMVPISFEIGRAGRAEKDGDRIIINPQSMQIGTLEKYANGYDIDYTELEEVSSFVYNAVYTPTGDFSHMVSQTNAVTEGWFRGIRNKERTGSSVLTTEWNSGDGSGVPTYKYDGEEFLVPEPLYFQSGTFLKTSLDPQDSYWDAYMGFIYDTSEFEYKTALGGKGISAPVHSNNTVNASTGVEGDYVWNLIPIPTNTLEGHATVYCYFDRTQFDGEHVLQYNVKEDAYKFNNKSANDKEGYIKRLNDPTLKYSDPW